MSEPCSPPRFGNHRDRVFLQQALAGTREFGVVADLFSQLSDPTRLRIFWMLCHSEACVSNIADLLEMSSPAVSHHLRSLRDTGLISGRREGKEVYYRASEGEAAQLLHHMIEQTMQITCPEEAELLSDFRADQVALIHDIHEYLLLHLDEKITIETLSRQFHVNATTLKTVFKSVLRKFPRRTHEGTPHGKGGQASLRDRPPDCRNRPQGRIRQPEQVHRSI